jgi:hypothetical protein
LFILEIEHVVSNVHCPFSLMTGSEGPRIRFHQTTYQIFPSETLCSSSRLCIA